MIDIFALAVSHGLMLIGLWRVVSSSDLDRDSAAPAKDPPGA